MSTNEIFNQMLSGYDITTEQQKRNAIFEVNQQVILAGLYNAGFFNEAAFYGVTSVRSSMPRAFLVRRHHYEDAFFVFSFYYPVCDVPCRAVKVDAYLGNWLLA